jgi:DNA-binding MarR family transcriptional regulator
MDEDLSDPDYRALLEFRYAIRSFLRFSEESAREAGIEPQQHQLMLAIKAGGSEGEARIGDLAERLQLRHHSTVELIDRLVAKGFAERQRAESDRRQVHVRLTKSGQQILRKLSMRHSEQLRSDGPELLRVLQEITKGESGKGERQAATQSPVGAR